MESKCFGAIHSVSMPSERIYEIATVGALLLACRAWYDVMQFLQTRERLRACDVLVHRGLELLELAMADPPVRVRKRVAK